VAEPRLLVARDAAAAAAALLAECVGERVRDEGRARLAVPGGSALAALGPARRALGDAWLGVRLTWVDERCVPFDDGESNRGSAYRCGALDAEHRPACELPLFLDGEDPPRALARVRRGLVDEFQEGLDVLLLGMGEDGHIASLFPGQRVSGAGAAYVAESPKPPPRRITLTRELLATARRSILLASGESKRAALERLLAGDARLPASGLDGLTVVSDLELAAPEGA
jgi:6-phosphogluconolactonase